MGDKYTFITRYTRCCVMLIMLVGIAVPNVLGQQYAKLGILGDLDQTVLSRNQDISEDLMQEKMSIKVEDFSLKEILKIIEQRSAFHMVYHEATVSGFSNISLEAKNQSLEKILNRLFRDLPLMYRVTGNYIIINEKLLPNLDKVMLQVVQGIVVDSTTGETMPGVNVVVKGTSIGTSTNSEGEYELEVPSLQDTLVFSFIGYQSKEVPINGRTEINVELPQQTIEGEDVVVVGYGTQTRQDVTGAVSSVSSQEIQEVPVKDAAQALEGRVPGVQIRKTGNRPGDNVEIRIRGRRSLTASNDPLFVVDGIPLEGGIDDINPANIVSMEVLKDASATAIYGSRGANGVILVTTDRGGDHAPQVSYNGYFGITKRIGDPNLMNTQEWANMVRESFAASGLANLPEEQMFTPTELEGVRQNRFTDWPDLVTKSKGTQQSHNLTVDGGDENTRYSISGSFFDEKGIIRGQDFERFSTRINLDNDINEQLRIGTSTELSFTENDFGANPFGGAITTVPVGIPFNEDGSVKFRPTEDGLIANPLADLVEDKVIDERKEFRLFSNVFGEYDITDNLGIRLNIGTDFDNFRRGVFQASRTVPRNEAASLARRDNQRTFSYTVENIIDYEVQPFNQNHNLKFTGLYSFQKLNTDGDFIEVTGLPSDDLEFSNLGLAEDIEDFGSNQSEWGLMSMMGRFNYEFRNKYQITLTARYDGSSRLAPGNRWGIFPSGAFGWVLSEENFMENVDFINHLKIRFSWGVTGNTAINPFSTLATLTQTDFQFGDQAAFGFRPATIANPDLEWEKSETVNFGLDFRLFDDRIAGSFEAFGTETRNMLLTRLLPISTGFGQVLQNIGESRTRGVEFNISSDNIRSVNGFNWTTDFNIFANNEKITKLFGDGEDDPGNEWFIGQPLSVWYEYEKIGIWQLDEAEEAAQFGQTPGEIKIKDQNNDGVINEQDKIIHGTDIPEFSLGINNRVSYKNFDFSLFLTGSFKQTIFNDFQVGSTSLNGRLNSLDVDFWTPTNPTNAHPRPNEALEEPLFSESRGFQDISFLKIRNMRLAYNLPGKWLDLIGISSATVYVNGENLITFSELDSAIDPQTGGDGVLDNSDADGDGDPLDDSTGFITAEVPNTRLISFGLNVDF